MLGWGMGVHDRYLRPRHNQKHEGQDMKEKKHNCVEDMCLLSHAEPQPHLELRHV